MSFLILFNNFQIIKVDKSRDGLIATGNNKSFMAMDTFGDDFRKMAFSFGNGYMLHSKSPVSYKKKMTEGRDDYYDHNSHLSMGNLSRSLRFGQKSYQSGLSSFRNWLFLKLFSIQQRSQFAGK